jgi:hypothetical protein|tara:strand:- start:11463 stop:11978 length:516 start_codon:yes stop_codon:yes gene_type:complete
MKRDYSDGVKNDVVYFTGYEVEKTPAFEEHTLFVVGPRPLQEVLEQAKKNTVDHIYLGANQSFNIDGGTSYAWDELVKGLLKENYMVTLDYDVRYHEYILESGYNEDDNFISQISVKLPYISQLNYNACIKIDDKDFKASNAGVWIHQVHDLQPRDKFTDWSKYENDNSVE